MLKRRSISLTDEQWNWIVEMSGIDDEKNASRFVRRILKKEMESKEIPSKAQAG